ncbi:Protein kinase of the Mitotic Exit Network [Coemansia erecta]|uniref:Protein kinase of the Mitotic Exit Network n=1 Tax=Coemansia erecta TaxID=147472 RepID=A0A9W8CTM9_9FUNG|nr:Protein kinase of the Mitotic Exit Network [Coemansia erecta]
MGESRRIGEYQLEDIIGKGAAGSVYRGINLRTGGVVAIKQIRKEGFSSYDEIEAARKEIDMLRDLHHPNIVKYIGYEQTEDELDIILEYCEGGSLQNILRKFNKFPENLVGVYVAQILDGLSYLHSNAILHRDIKPGNILLLKEGIVKLADFGVARVQNGMNTVVGSPYWIAPEVLQLKGATTASDIWSLGCTIVQLVDGKAPYQDLQPMAAMFRIGQDEHPPFPHNISVQLRDFLSKCLVHVPSARAAADELRCHEWIRTCLREQQREQQREGQAHRNYERDIRAITQWNQVLQNSSPRDVKQDVSGAISGVSSMGISNSNDSTTRRTVSSIAAYEEDSGDDWENAFQNLDALQLKPKSRPGIQYPQSIGAPMSPAVGPRKLSLTLATDAQDADHPHFMAAPVERAVSDPANGQGATSLQLRPHTSPPSPRMAAMTNAGTVLSSAEYTLAEYNDGRNSTSSNENGYADTLEYIDGGRVSGSSVYYASTSDVRLDAMNDSSSKRPSLGLRQDAAAHSSSAHLLQLQQQSSIHTAELQAESIGFISRLCRSEDLAPIQMLLAADGILALCETIGLLVELDVSVAATQLSRVVTSLMSLVISKTMPSDMSAADMGDLLSQSHIIHLLNRVFAKYGEACHLPSSGQSSTNGSDTGGQNSQSTVMDRVYHGVCDVLIVTSRLLNEIIRRIDSLQDAICDSDILEYIFMHLHQYPRKAVVLVIHGVRFLSKNPASLDILDKAGIFSVSVMLLKSPFALAYREYVMSTVLRLCSSSLDRQNTMATQHPYLVSAAMDFAQLKEAPTLSKCGRLIILGLANGGAPCCRVLKEVNAFELIVKLISRERWCGQAIRALLEWTREVSSDIVPSLTNENSAAGWSELAGPLLTLSTSSTTLDMYAATFYSLVRLYVPQFPRACMGTGEANDECLWIMLIDRYLKCSRLGGREPPNSQASSENMGTNNNNNSNAAARPEVVAANHMNATTRLTFLNLLLLLQPHLRITSADMRRRISHYYTEMVISSKLDAALPVRKASLELSLALGRM